MPDGMENLIQEFAPSRLVSPFVQSYWYGEFNRNEGAGIHRLVLPHGCIELIIHLGSHHCTLLKDGKVWTCTPEFTLLGLHPKPYEVQFLNSVSVFAIRIYPDGFKNIFNAEPAELISTFENGLDVLGIKIREFCLRIRELQDIDQRVAMAEAFILRQLNSHARAYDYTHLAMRAIRQQQGKIDYDMLREDVPISQRQLQREFKKVYGITIKDYMRILRMNAVLNYMSGPTIKLTELSHNHCFFDQSHFNKEFKHFVGLSPRQYLREQNQYILNKGF